MSKPLDVHYSDEKDTIVKKPGVGILVAAGTTVPADATTGYATGCIFIHTDGAAGTALYVNEGDADSSDFDPLFSLVQSAALTAADGSTVDTTYGQEEADVISNLVTRVGEIEAALEAAKIVAAN